MSNGKPSLFYTSFMESKKLKAAITVWHTPHQLDLMTALKDYVDFDVIVNTNRAWTGRPFPDFAKFVPFYEKGKYDFAILNLDQQAINTRIYKSHIYGQMKEAITDDVPIFIIQHGGPVYPEEVAKNGITFEQSEEEIRRFIKNLAGDYPMVVNSYTAASDKEWGFGYPIVHGMNSDYWRPEEVKEPRIITALSPAGCDAYYNRALMQEFGNVLKRKHGLNLQWARISKEASFAKEQPDAYRDWLATSLIYVDTSVRTPMNRARTEAMLSGCCVVQIEGAHDLDRFFHPGKDIVLVPDNNPDVLADVVSEYATTKINEAKAIGMAARENAKIQFSYERYAKDWLTLLASKGIYKGAL